MKLYNSFLDKTLGLKKIFIDYNGHSLELSNVYLSRRESALIQNVSGFKQKLKILLVYSRSL